MAKASLEMAVLDALLKSRSLAMADWFGTTRINVNAGATVGIFKPDELTTRVQSLIEQGYRRIKLKVKSSARLETVIDLTEAYPQVDFQIDANGSCNPDDISRLVDLSNHVTAIEQPFSPDQVEATRQLVAQVNIPIVADEPIDSAAVAKTLVDGKACSALAVKPARLGGILPSLDLYHLALAWGIPLSIGGMMECGLGRHSLAVVAALDGFTLDGDLSPARRWLETDPWPDIKMQAVDGVSQIVVPSDPGIAPQPDLEILEAVTTNTIMVT